MSSYIVSTNFATKDALASGDPLKIVKGTEINTEFNNIAAAVATKADLTSPAFAGTPTAPTAASNNNTTQLATTAFVAASATAVLNLAYPVGAIYTSVSATNPNSLFGGTWVAFAAGRMMMGAGGAFGAGTIGGSYDSTLPSHSHTASTTSTDSGHAHGYTFRAQTFAVTGSTIQAWEGTSSQQTSTSYANISSSTTVNAAGSSPTNTNLPPYIVVYMWQRTA